MSASVHMEGEGVRDVPASVLLLAVSALICSMPLFARGGLPDAHDTIFHAFQADQFSKAFEEGSIYPRWVAGANNGYGSPTFVFYAPLSYFFVAVLNLIVKSFIRSMTLAVWAGFFLSGSAMFFAARRMSGERGALPAALLYQLAPFHVNDIYLRGTFAEFFAFMWFPLIFLFLHECVTRGGKGPFIGLALSYAGLILTHLVSGFIFGVVAILCLGYSLLRVTGRKHPLMAAFSLLAGLGLSAFYLLPAVYERKFVQIEYLTTCVVCDYRGNFLFTDDRFKTILKSFFLVLHLLVVLETALFASVMLPLRGRKGALNGMVFPALAFGASLFLVLPVSRPLWDVMPGFATLQFPWRWISVMEPALCLMASRAFGVTASEGRIKGGRRPALYAMALAFVSLAIISNSHILPDGFLREIIKPRNIALHMEPTIEYAPRRSDPRRVIAEGLSGAGGDSVSIVEGSGGAGVALWQSESRRISVTASTAVTLRVATFFYPGWEASIDGRPAQIKTEEGTGAILVNVPEGKHDVELAFKDTPLRRRAKMVSAASALFIAVFVLYRGRKKARA